MAPTARCQKQMHADTRAAWNNLTFSFLHYHYKSYSDSADIRASMDIFVLFLHLNRKSHVRSVGREEMRKHAELTALKSPTICQVQQLLVSMATRQGSFLFFGAEGLEQGNLLGRPPASFLFLFLWHLRNQILTRTSKLSPAKTL